MKKLLSLFMLLFATVGLANAATDVLDYAFTGIDGTNYADWTATGTSGAVYAGNSGGTHSSIQLRSNNNNSGIVTTTSGGKVQKITVTWNSNTTNGRTLNVYGKNTAYTAATELYSSSTQGTLLGTIVKGTTTELTITGDYEYIGLRSASSAMYIDQIEIVWGDSGITPPQYQSIPYSETLISSQGLFTIQDESLGGLTAVWQTSQYGMTANGKNCTDNIESWFISPLIDGTSVEAINLTFEENVRYFADQATAEAQATLWVREGADGTWAQVTIPTHTQADNNNFHNVGNIDLSAYAGKIFQIGFKYTATTTSPGRWELKNLAVTEGVVPTPQVSTVAEFNLLEQGKTFEFVGTGLIASVQNGKYLYAQDETGGMLIYGTITPSYSKGDVIPAGFTATKGAYNGASQASSPENMEDAVDVGTITAKEFAAADFTASTFAELANFGIYGVVRGVTVNGNTITLADGTTVVNTHNTFEGVPSDASGKIYEVYGIMGWSNGVEFLPIEYNATGATNYAIPTITVNPEKDVYFVGDQVTVTIACEDTGASIGYDITDSESFPEQYTELTNGGTITITADEAKVVTVRAFAYGEDLDNSEVATKTLTFVVQPEAGDQYELVTSADQIAAGKEYVLVYSNGTVTKAMSAAATYGTNNVRTVVDAGSLEFTLENDVVTLMSTTTVTPFVLETADTVAGYYNIKIDGDKYLSWKSGNTVETDTIKANVTVTLDAEGNVAIVRNGARYLQYNTSSPRFAFYTGTQKNGQLYVKKEAAPEYETGDVNGDGDINVVDITALIDAIMNDDTTNPRADVNGDGNINVVDITVLIDIIMNM